MSARAFVPQARAAIPAHGQTPLVAQHGQTPERGTASPSANERGPGFGHTFGDVASSPPPSSGLLQRKCSCGGRGASECEECRNKRQSTLQRRAAGLEPDRVPPIVHEVLRTPGQPLDADTRAFMEPRLGHDFSHVRVHTDTRAAKSADSVNARAYTVGRHVVFGPSQFRRESRDGSELIAHELAHVVQQDNAATDGSLHIGPSGTPPELEADRLARAVANGASGNTLGCRPKLTSPPRVDRAELRVGSLRIQIDYGRLGMTPRADYVAEIETRFTAYASQPAATIHASVTALTPLQQEWVLFGLDLLADNTSQAPGLNRPQAVQRLITRAPAASTRPLGSPGTAFEREVLTVSGWFDIALSSSLAAPTPADLTFVDRLYNPPPTPSAPHGGALDLARLRNDLPPLVNARLARSGNDPANWPGTRTQALGPIQSVGDVIQAAARTFFAPFVENARDNRWLLGWQYSANIFSVTATATTQDQRMALLRNRAEAAGYDSSSGPSFFSQINFNSTRDAAAIEAILVSMEATPAVQALLDRQLQHTGRLERPSLRVGISTEVSTGRPECVTRWSTIKTLCHELMHSLAHPDFISAISSSTRFPSGVQFPQILNEGFAEVLGVELFDSLRSQARLDAAMKSRLETGLPGACAVPTGTTAMGYGDAAANARDIRIRLGNERFRAAYFLGRASLIGL